MTKLQPGFSQLKKRIVKILDYRLENLQEMSNVLISKGGRTQHDYVIQDAESKIDELETLRDYIQGLQPKHLEDDK